MGSVHVSSCPIPSSIYCKVPPPAYAKSRVLQHLLRARHCSCIPSCAWCLAYVALMYVKCRPLLRGIYGFLPSSLPAIQAEVSRPQRLLTLQTRRRPSHEPGEQLPLSCLVITHHGVLQEPASLVHPLVRPLTWPARGTAAFQPSSFPGRFGDSPNAVDPVARMPIFPANVLRKAVLDHRHLSPSGLVTAFHCRARLV